MPTETLDTLSLTHEQLVDLDSILGGVIWRYQQELRNTEGWPHAADDGTGRVAFYMDWLRRAEAVQAVVLKTLQKKTLV